jgi:alpha-glucosidase
MPPAQRSDPSAPLPAPDPTWWRDAVVYQIYPRSFADGNGDGIGDLAGMISRLGYLHDLGVDAVWVSPWYPSPLHDGGYDVADYFDVHPDFGTLDEARHFVAEAHRLGLRVLIDLVPNHCSIEHPLFRAALAAGRGSPERDYFIFCDGRSENGDQPPNNWAAAFGGSAWQRVHDADDRPEQWYLHLFAPEQPDWNWQNPEVVDYFDQILAFWFDLGIDGFRIDVADAMVKDPGYPDMPEDPSTGLGVVDKSWGTPAYDQPGVHEVHRHWRRLADSYAGTDLGARILIGEVWLTPVTRLAQYVRPGELHCTFNFDALTCAWDPDSLRNVINLSSTAMHDVGAPATWVLANHDTVRVVTRYGKPVTGFDYTPAGQAPPSWSDDAELAAMPTDIELGRRRARTAALLEFALPGGAYIYQGDELGLDEVEDLPDDARQDPAWERSGHTRRGRDGARVPLPWSGTHETYAREHRLGFGSPTHRAWLPQPERWADLTVTKQDQDRASHLALYRSALATRHQIPALGDGELVWDTDAPAGVLSFTRGDAFRCMINLGDHPVALPDEHDVILASVALDDHKLGPDAGVWLRPR